MKILLVSGIIMVNLIVSKNMLFVVSGSRSRKCVNLWTTQYMTKSCRYLSFSTPNFRYKLFIGLNCRIPEILFCDTINGCMNFFVVFT